MSNPTGSKKRISLAKRLHEISAYLETHEKLPDDMTWVMVRKLAKSLVRSVAAVERAAENERKRALVQRDLLTCELHGEMVDRDANAARVAERQRFLYDRACVSQHRTLANERAAASAAFVEAAIVALCPHYNAPSHGCELIANTQKAN